MKMISVKNKFIIITPPKTGSVSITTFMMKYINVSNIIQQRSECFDYSDHFSKTSKHTSIDEMYKKWDENILGNFNDYQKFGTIRNPWDRLVSWWKWENSGKSFSDFIRFPSSFHSRDILQDYFSINNKIIINSYIRFENIQEDFNNVCSKIEVPNKKLLHMNKSKHKHYEEYYNDELQNIVALRYKAEIKQFNYEY